MSSNFGISVYRNNKILQLKLSGDFDGSSALQLLSLMRNCVNEPDKIIINTDSISIFEPTGLNIFRYNLGSLVKHTMKFFFTGEKASFLTETLPYKNRSDFKTNIEGSCNIGCKINGEDLFY